MSRVALIGENSVCYINTLLDIWNNGDCAVLIDWRIPPKTGIEMMNEACVHKCYIEKKFFQQKYEFLSSDIDFIEFDNNSNSAGLVPQSVYNKFHENYSKREAIVIYSSGTTGKSKGIILSHFAINTNADAIIDYMQPCDSDCMYIVKNFTHSSTITGELLVALKTRTQILIAPVVVPPRFVLCNIVKYNVTMIGVNPLLLSMYCNECQNRTYDLSTLKKIYVSGSILSDKTYAIAHEVFNKQKIYNVYGLSEVGPRVTAQRDDCCKGNSVGKAIKGVDIVIVTESGNIAANSEFGIVHVNSPSRFNGYIQGELKHKSLYQDWLNTGDIGYFDEYDELHIVGRIDDMLIIGVHKVYPSEVERHIYAVSAIQECVVTMVNYRDEDTLCCLYVSDEKIREDIKNILGTVLTKHEIPKLFVKTNAIPKTCNGKVSLNDVKEAILRELKGELTDES